MAAHDIESVDVFSGYRLRLRFADGVVGTIDIREHIPFEGLFAPLADPAFFEQVAIYPELKTIYWPGDVDVCHDLLYQWATQSLPVAALF
jgi:hypothetical protein